MSDAAAAAPPAAPIPLARSLACIATSCLLALTQGLGMNLIAANVGQLQGALGATAQEATWLIAAYMAPNVSLTILLTKIRTQFGLRAFAEIGILIFIAASVLHLFVFDLASALPVRFIAGMAAAPMSTLAFLYMLEAFPPALKLRWGLSLALTNTTIMPTVARLLSPYLLDIGEWRGLYTLEVGLALLALPAVYLLPLVPIPRAKVLHWKDFISYPLVAVGFGLIAAVLAVGRLYWWFEAPWIGACLAGAVLAIGLAAAIEINRDTPLINIQWLTSGEIVRFALTLLVFRIVLAEQTSGALGLYQTLGLLNEQSRSLNGIILLASLAGGLFCGMVMTLGRVRWIHGLSLLCIAVGAAMDSQATSLTRPQDMHVSQALIAFGGALFLPPALLVGLTKTMQRGQAYLTSFFTVFLFTQSIGGLMGSALFGSFVTLREKLHSNYLVEHIALTDPIVADRVRQLAGLYGRVLTDSRLLNAEGLALLSQQATREANVLAYNDAFLMLALIALFALACLIVLPSLFRLCRRPAAPPAATPSATTP